MSQPKSFHRLTDEQIVERAGIIKGMHDAGETLTAVANRLGVTPAAVIHFKDRYMHGDATFAEIIRRRRAEPSAPRKAGDENPSWQRADPSTLTEDQLEACKSLRIPPERMAWLLSCPILDRKAARSARNQIGG